MCFSVFDLVDVKMVFEAVEVGAVDGFHCLGHGLLVPKSPKLQAKIFKSRNVTIHFFQSEALWDRQQDAGPSRRLGNLA